MAVVSFSPVKVKSDAAVLATMARLGLGADGRRPACGLALDLALVLGRPQAFEYVLVHELCHLIHADHSKAFWREVEARFPAWREERDYFHAEGRRLKTALHLLLAG